MCFKASMPTVNLTGRDIVSERESQIPDSPHFGGSYTESERRRGRESLLIKKNSVDMFRPTNY